jgi:hypothetical protein
MANIIPFPARPPARKDEPGEFVEIINALARQWAARSARQQFRLLMFPEDVPKDVPLDVPKHPPDCDGQVATEGPTALTDQVTLDG